MFETNPKFSLCRICLATLLQSDVYNIFHTLDLEHKLRLCSRLPVESTDEYPENVCPKCYEKIILFYEFQQMCRKSLDSFKKLLETYESSRDKTSRSKIIKENQFAEVELPKSVREKSIVTSENVQTFNEFAEKKKSARPQRKKLEHQRPERKTVIKRSSGTVIRKSIASSSLCAAVEHEETKVFLKVESISADEEYLDEEFCDNLNTEEANECDSSKKHIYNTQEENEEKSTLKYRTDLQEISATQKQMYQCGCCSKEFKSLLRLEAHVRQHEGSAPYICTYEGCECSFNRLDMYKKHQKDQKHNLIVKEESFKCDVDNCERSYKSKSNLNIHKRKFHNLGPELKKTHMCEICGKVFKSSAILNDHQYTHFDKTQLPYACEEEGCSKRFSNKEKLKTHKMRHAGIKNFMCPYCGMRKTTRNELKIHINYHTLERTWSCRFCPKVCNSAGNLKMHVKNVHEGAKDFACSYCERTFAKADTKKYHEMTHTGEKPHQCKECGRRFVQPAALRTHRKIHLKQKKVKLTEKRKSNKVNAVEGMQNVMENTDEANTLTESIVAEILIET